MFRRLILSISIVLLTGCESTPVTDVSTIQTTTKLTQGLELPIDVPIAIYVDKGKPEPTYINFFGKLGETSEMVASDMFSSAELLKGTSDFHYLFRYRSASNFSTAWGTWKSEVWLDVVDSSGNTVFSTSAKGSSTGGGFYDMNSVHNSLAKPVKETLISFINDLGSEGISEATAHYSNREDKPDLKSIMQDLKPASTGTGFFVNDKGEIATAAHVVNQCLFVEVKHKEKVLPASIAHSSRLLDLAVLDTDFQNAKGVTISKSDSVAHLGKQVFVTGYPLSGILADYPSLTVGNISSLGGLKGAKQHFQFTAPVQPGNSGGAVVDYKGNLVGVVSASLNQGMLLQETGTTAQNVNFGVDLSLLKKFLDSKQVSYQMQEGESNFELASKDAVDYTNQVLCYR